MIPSTRIHRGFHRVGVVLAALALLLVGIAAFLHAAARAVGRVLAGFVGADRA